MNVLNRPTKTQWEQDEGDRYHSKSKAIKSHHRRVRTSSAFIIQPTSPRSYRERQASGCWPRNHDAQLLSSRSSLMYAMRVLRAHGTPTTSLHTFFVPQSFLGFRTGHQRGRECVRLMIARVFNRGCVVPNDSVILRRRRADRRRPIRLR